MKRFVVSAFMGFAGMAAVNFTSALTGVSVPVSLLSVSVTGTLGIPGLIAVMVLDSIIPI